MAAFVKGIGEQLRGREMAGRISESTMRRVDWLAVAIGNLGGPNRAAKRLGLSPQTVYTWITKGLRGVDFAKVYNLSKEGDVPLEYLARRLGPWDGPMELPKLNDEGADFDDEA